MTVTAAMCHIYISCFWCCLRYCLNYFHNIIVIAKLKNNLHLSAPFKAQGCGGNLSTYQLGSAHTHTHTHTHTGLQAKQSARRKYVSFCLVQKGLANNGENWDGKIPKCCLKCWCVCLKKKKNQGDVSGSGSWWVEVNKQSHSMDELYSPHLLQPYFFPHI
jgi:hypothetical protein